MDELGSRMEMTEDQSRVLKDRSIEFTQSEQQTGRGKKKRQGSGTITKDQCLKNRNPGRGEMWN